MSTRPNICVSKRFVLLSSILVALLLGILGFSSLSQSGRKTLSSRAADIQCIYSTQDSCSKECTELCTQSGCGNDMYRCISTPKTPVCYIAANGITANVFPEKNITACTECSVDSMEKDICALPNATCQRQMVYTGLDINKNPLTEERSICVTPFPTRAPTLPSTGPCSPACPVGTICQYIAAASRYACSPLSTTPLLTPSYILTPTPITSITGSCSTGIADFCKKWGANGCIIPEGGVETCTLNEHYYYSQKDPRWIDAPIWANGATKCKNPDGTEVAYGVNGCALTLALTLLSEHVNPTIWNPGKFTNGYTPVNHCYGISIDDGLKMLTDNGFTVGVPIDAPLDGTQITQIKKLLSDGWLIWVTMIIKDPKEGFFGHHSLIIGVNEAGVNEKDTFIFNDPYFGAGITFAGIRRDPMKYYPIRPPKSRLSP